MAILYYKEGMKTLTVRLPDAIAADIDAESHARMISQSDVVRERLVRGRPVQQSSLDAIADLIGSIDGLPEDLSSRKKEYLRTRGYGRDRHR